MSADEDVEASELPYLKSLQYRCGRCGGLFCGEAAYSEGVAKEVIDALVRGDHRPRNASLNDTHWCPDGEYGVGHLVGYAGFQ